MADISSRATVDLSINGKQAQDALKRIADQAVQVRKKMDECVMKNDLKGAERHQRHLDRLQKRYDKLQNSTIEFEHTLKQLDKATPRQLNAALNTLQRNLSNLQRGSKEWDRQVAKIRAVKAEMQKLNATLAASHSTSNALWSKFMNWCNNAQAAVMAVVAAVTGLVMAGRKAVQSYADIEEQMANTIKYTRMTAAEVEELNEIFKGMDTRLAREQLNLLAQEGGRLGYNTVASVKEYVEAASIINVALVDLGEGATQTIAKLSNIFGMEQMYGVRDAMLKIGSTVNHLSQNCTAAKPFIVEFAQRMAGIGSTAKMTIPEIMAFAATLDAHGQKVEMSATALQRTIMELFKKPAEMAKKVGLETNTLIETLNKSTTQGVMMFLEALNKLGEDKALAILSPLFQDLGLDGTRVSSVLSNLSSHLDFLKWQLGEAAQAFHDGTSASNEYAIFNNTVQASIDKARKRVGELAIELGEKLYPLMRHIYTSSSAFMRVLNVLVSFIIEHRKAIAAVVTVIATYYSWSLLVKTATIAWHAVLGVGKAIMNAYRVAIVLGRVAIMAFTTGIGSATHAMRLLNAIIRANPFGLLITVVTAVVVAIKALCDSTSEYTKKMREARNTAASFSEELNNEMRNIDSLIGKLQAAEKGTKQYKTAKDEIIKQYGKYLNGLINERGEITNLTAAYNRLAAAARIAAKERSIQTARENADETHRDAFKEQAKKLQQALIEQGKSLRDAVRITNSVVYQLETTGTLSADIVAELQAIKGRGYHKLGWGSHPVNIVNEMIGQQTEYRETMSSIDNIEREQNPLGTYTESDLKRIIPYLEERAAANQGGTIVLGIDKPNPTTRNLSAREVKEFLDEAKARLSVAENPTSDPVAGNPDFSLDNFTPYESDKERKKREREEAAAASRAETKARKDFKEALDVPKAAWEKDTAQNVSEYSSGLKTWSDFLLRKHEIELKYYTDREDVYKKFNLTEDEDYQALLKKKADYEAEWLKKNAAMKVQEAKRQQQAEETQVKMDFYTPGNAIYGNEQAMQQKLFEIKIKYLKKIQASYNKASEEYVNTQYQIDDALNADRLDKQKKFAEAYKKYSIEYAHKAARERYDYELKLIISLFMMGKLKAQEYIEALKNLRKQYVDSEMPESAQRQKTETETDTAAMQKDLKLLKSQFDQKLITETEYLEARDRLERHYQQKALDRAAKSAGDAAGLVMGLYSQFAKFADWDKDTPVSDKLLDIGAAAQASYAVMQAAMSQYQEFAEAQNAIDIARIEKRYDLESSLAEGNVYRQKQAEQKKEREIARIKSESSRRAYAMQVISAVAQTAINAINAYGSAAAIPVVGHIIAPIAAAAAVAAGMIQIATLKKQQQQAAATGYREGGFTPNGPADREVGVVHAGEWVAPADMVRDPRTRPIIDLLETARRSNRIGAITYADVSRDRLTASAMTAALSSAAASSPGLSSAAHGVSSGAAPLAAGLTDAITRLNSRLEGPIITVNTVSGDNGYRRAEDEYDRLIKNKSPK